MFIIDKVTNKAMKVNPQTLTDLGLKEKDHLQEWIAENPAMLGEELLIIQKEFSGWADTKERFDLLALDKDGNLVVIENKRDDTGTNVTWQALKYVSFCSMLTANDIIQIFQAYLEKFGTGKDAKTELCEFFDQEDISKVAINQGDQRIILVATFFRKEVTSTVMWLFERGIKIKCIKVTPYKHGENIFIDPEQIIPIKDAEEYQIKLAQKKQQASIATETRRQTNYQQNKEICDQFWDQVLPKMKEASPLFNEGKIQKNRWDVRSYVDHGIYYRIRGLWDTTVSLCIERGTEEANKKVFEKLFKHKDEIESKFGDTLEWIGHRKEACWICYSTKGGIRSSEGNWGKMVNFFVEYMPKLEAATRDILDEVLANEPDTAVPEEQNEQQCTHLIESH